jgi:hypothetical protein
MRMGNSRGREKHLVKERRRDASSIRLTEFDVDYDATNLEDILGPIFAEAIFRSDVERQTIAKDILQMVLLSPHASAHTRVVAWNELGRINSGALFQQTVDMAGNMSKMGLTTALLDPEEKGGDRIEPPILGRESTVSASISKNLLAAIGGKRLLSMPKDGSKPVIHALPTIANAISNNNLNAEAAFTVMLNITCGVLYDYIYSAQHNNAFGNQTARFEHMWYHIQKISRVTVSNEYYEKELERLITMKPTKDISEILTRIQTTIQKMYENLPGAEERATMIKTKTIAYLFHWVQHHYDYSFSQIESVYEDERQADIRKKNNARIQGIPYESTFEPIDSLISVIISYLDKKKHMFQGVHIGKSKVGAAQVRDPIKDNLEKEKEHKKQVAKMHAAETKQNDSSNSLKEIQTSISAMASQIQKLQMPNGAHNAAPGGKNMQGQRNAGGQNRYCALCNLRTHDTDVCYTYSGQRPGVAHCTKCGGRHSSECRRPSFPQNRPQNGGGQNRSGNNGNNENSNKQSQSQGQMKMGEGIGNANRQPSPVDGNKNH